MSAPPSKSLQYFVTIAATAVAFLARFLLKSALGYVAPLLMFTFSVVVSAWSGGLGPGLLATALSLLLGDYFFIEREPRGADRRGHFPGYRHINFHPEPGAIITGGETPTTSG